MITPRGPITGIRFPTGKTFSEAAGPLVKWGATANKDTTAVANTKFIQAYLESTATDAGSDSRGMYLRMYFSGATTGGGEALRAYTTINAAVVGTAHGAHLSLDFVSVANSGRLTGLGAAARCTLHIPSDADWTSGTLAAIMAEIFTDGEHSDPDGLAELSFIRVVNDGDASGKAAVDDDAFLFSIQGFDEATGGMVFTSASAQAAPVASGSIKIKVGSTTRYLTYVDAEVS